jgi:hypothetical protein
LGRRFFVDNLRYFKFVGTKLQASGYSAPKPKVGVIYPEEPYIKDRAFLFEEEWQEVYVSDVEPVPQKTFPPDAVTLDRYVGGKWYDVREVLPDEGFDKLIFVELYSREIKQVVWDDKDQKFIRLTGETCDDVKEWRAYYLGE